MVKTYSREPALPARAAKTSASDLRVHYKNTYETARAVKGMGLRAAIKYLKDVIAHKRCIPFFRYNGHVGRTAQAKEFGTTQGRWPVKSCKVILGLLQNLEANANVKSLDIDKMIISHVQVNRAQKGRRRTYRAHGRINPYLSSHCHIEMFAVVRDEDVKKEADKKSVAKLTKKQIAKQRLRAGEHQKHNIIEICIPKKQLNLYAYNRNCMVIVFSNNRSGEVQVPE